MSSETLGLISADRYLQRTFSVISVTCWALHVFSSDRRLGSGRMDNAPNYELNTQTSGRFRNMRCVRLQVTVLFAEI